MSSSLALFGAARTRIKPFESWPVFGSTEEQNLLRVLRSGKRGRLSGDEVATFEQRFARAARVGLHEEYPEKPFLFGFN